MMAEVISITSAHRGAYLGTASFYRMPNGEIAVMVTDMADHMIESWDTVPERFHLFADWLREGAADLEAQALEFTEEQ
jgi:hypothetical protein